jgi:Cu(I)/Ag(I) efflux system membrane protein CusA/SilA
LRSYQDWYLSYYLRSVPGVAEVAPIGGYTRQYQVNLDPNRLRAYGIAVSRVVEAVRGGNSESSGRLLEFGGTEYMVRGRGYARSLEDFENIPLSVSETGSQIRIRDVGHVEMGPDLRRGLADLNGSGETVSGIVVMRNGENALDVIDRVKAKIKEIEPGFPPGVKIVPIYDRSELIHNAIGTVKTTILEVGVTVALIIIVFLWHFPSAAIPIVTMPVAVLLAFIPFRMMGISANIMSLAGVAIAFSELVDASIVVAEQTHKKLELWEKAGRLRDRREIVLAAIKEVAGPTFFALLVIAVSFLPVLTLQAQEGRMFRPLAYTKTLTMVAAALLAITLDPALRLFLNGIKRFEFRPEWLSRVANALLIGKVRSEESHPISRHLIRLYEPVVRWTLRRKWFVIGAAVALMILTVPVFFRLGSESMPPLDEGAILYMPTTLPGISIHQAEQLLQVSDHILSQFPEVDHVLGKAGRAETATDPAPLSMLETLIVLKPHSAWRHVDTWYSAWAPEWARSLFRHITPDTISTEELVGQMNEALKIPGVNNAWTMPIRGRIDMLTTGLRTPLGLKIAGADLQKIQAIGTEIESLLKSVQGTRTVLAERTAEGHFLDLQWDREHLARYGVSVEDAQRVVENAIGGENVTTVVLGQERYGVNVRFQRDFRSDIGSLGAIPIPAGGQRQLTLSDLAQISIATGPAMIRNENGLLTGYVYVDVAGRDPGSYISEANQLLRDRIKLPAGYSIGWSGQYESMQRATERLKLVVPITLFLIVLLLYFNTRSFPKTIIVLLAVPFSAVGALWFLYFAGYNLSVAVWVGLIALLGIDAETGVFMLLYLDLSCAEAQREGRLNSLEQLREAIVQGAAKRLRPKFMTFATTCVGLFPIMWATGAGSDVMKRIAAAMVGGIFTSFVLELLVYPAIYEVWKWGLNPRKVPEDQSSTSLGLRPVEASGSD